MRLQRHVRLPFKFRPVESVGRQPDERQRRPVHGFGFWVQYLGLRLGQWFRQRFWRPNSVFDGPHGDSANGNDRADSFGFFTCHRQLFGWIEQGPDLLCNLEFVELQRGAGERGGGSHGRSSWFGDSYRDIRKFFWNQHDHGYHNRGDLEFDHRFTGDSHDSGEHDATDDRYRLLQRRQQQRHYGAGQLEFLDDRKRHGKHGRHGHRSGGRIFHDYRDSGISDGHDFDYRQRAHDYGHLGFAG